MKSSLPSFSSSRPGRKVALFAAVVAVALESLVSTALATDYYWRATDNSSTWNTTSKWFTSPTGGLQSTGMSSADTYTITNTGSNVTNTEYLTSGTSTFLGGTLVLATGGQLNIRTSTTAQSIIPNFVTTGGGVIAAAYTASQPHTLVVTSFDNESGTTTLNATNNRDLHLEISTLSGSGDFSIGASSKVYFSATDATAYTGGLDLSTGTINFDNDLVSGGSLTLSGSAVVTLDQSVTFASVTVAGTALSAGFHSFADLNAAYDTFFTNGGSGGITVGVIPEPSSLALLAGCAALLGTLVRRRRRS